MAVCALTVLDSVGDEATALGGVVLLVVVIILAWLSTHVADRGDHILGTILTVGAHASLISLGGHDSYDSPSGTDVEDQPGTASVPEEKPEEEESRAEEDELLDIRRVRKRRRKVSKENKASREHTDGEDEEESDEDNTGDDDDEEEDEEEEIDDESERITVRLKYLNDTEEVAVLRPHDTVGLLKSKYFSGRERQIKLIWQGQLLQDPRRTLSSLNIMHNSVLHCHISQAPVQAEAPVAGQAEENARPGAGSGSGADSGLSGGIRWAGVAVNSSSLVVPVFVVMLAVVWYFRIHYRQLFTAPATVSLVGVTVFFSFFIFGMHSR